VPNAVAPPPTAAHVLEWLAISLTQGLGPTRCRKPVEHFGTVEAVLQASLTELESTGIPAVSAQSLAAGKSAELAREEIARAAAAGVSLVSLDDPAYPPRLKEIYDPPLILYVRGNVDILARPGVDVLYPKENSRLSEQILALRGALISESAWHLRGAAELSHSQPHSQRHVPRSAGD
jgi:predicted Rossmann fold nucleotide-binding protein DprA/Smf involved in DNA uptake